MLNESMFSAWQTVSTLSSSPSPFTLIDYIHPPLFVQVASYLWRGDDLSGPATELKFSIYVLLSGKVLAYPT